VSTRTTVPIVRRRSDLVALLAGAAVLALGMFLVRDSDVPDWERELFLAINGLPGALYPVLWPFQQLGALLVGPLVALVAAALRRYRLAAAALLVTAGKLVLERVVKAMVTRERPGTSIGDEAELRGDVSSAGESFVSGHAVLVTALAMVVLPYLRGRWRLVPVAVAGLVLLTRVYVGAHNPLDVVAGAALGVMLGAAVNLALGVPDER
jgi:undecaprenyl-diphosphatase